MMRIPRTLAAAPRLAALSALLGCVLAVLVCLPFPECAGDPASDVCRADAVPSWGARPVPAEHHNIESRRADWTGVRPAFQPCAALSGAADCPLPTWQTDRLPLEARASLQAPSAGVRLGRAPPRNS
jgi:hypothetical protein